MQKLMLSSAALAALIALPRPASAAVRPHPLISENMILQRGMAVPVWGTADDGEKVTVEIQGKRESTRATGGSWQVRLKDLKTGGPYTMTITGSNRIELQNVMVGEVWVASGQSNMEWPLSASANPEAAISAARNPLLRLFTVPKTHLDKPTTDVKGAWQEAAPQSVERFSAVAYYFGRDLQKALGVPVGMIHTSWGGTPAEAWTSRRVLESDPQLQPILDRYSAAMRAYPLAKLQYDQALARWREESEKARQEGRPVPRQPQPPFGPQNPTRPSALYNGMIAPLLPYGIRGAIWYQGESNAGRAVEYQRLFPAMIRNWREDWGQGDFPFFFVQLAPFMAKTAEPGESAWAELREAQRLTAKTLPHTGMAVITDVGDERDIHPRQKEPVGARLALQALGTVYGKDVAYSGPEVKSAAIEGDRIVLRFNHASGGLVAKDGALQGFTIAGEDRKWVTAQAEIRGSTIVVWSPQVKKPISVRYGWASFPQGNLWNGAGLPASPFRTDDFPLTTAPR